MLEDVILSAIERKFLVYGLTEHVPRYRTVDLYPEEADMSLLVLAKQFEDFVNEAHRLRIAYSQQINLLVGLETEYITTLDLDRLDDLLQSCGDQIHYLVGSVHHVNGIPIDIDIDTYYKAVNSLGIANEEQAREKYLISYLEAQYELLRRFRPEIIGHIDLCRLYTPDMPFSNFPRAQEKLIRNIQFAVEYGALFEVNAAALRKGWATPYPGTDVIELICQEGGRLTISDDSHGPHAVGLHYGLVKDYLISVGVQNLWHIDVSTSRNAGGRKTAPVKLPGDWWAHPFWTG
jgi:histidinol-phosphatase (PHP family)